MKKYFLLGWSLLKEKPDLIMFPIIGGFVWFFQTIAAPTWSMGWISTFDPWISSFVLSITVFSFVDLFLNKVSFFKRHRYLSIIISFFTSTFIGESLTYTINENLTWGTWLLAFVQYVIGFVVLLFCVFLGLAFGIEKEKTNLVKEEERYKATLDSMPKNDKKILAQKLKKALRLDDATFDIILELKSKENIKELFNDLI